QRTRLEFLVDNPDDLVFLGRISDRSTLLNLYRRSGVTISCSELEAFPLVLHEAGSQGAPLALTDIPSHRELAGSNAEYFRVGDIHEGATMVNRCLTNPRPEPWSWPISWAEHANRM